MFTNNNKPIDWQLTDWQKLTQAQRDYLTENPPPLGKLSYLSLRNDGTLALATQVVDTQISLDAVIEGKHELIDDYAYHGMFTSTIIDTDGKTWEAKTIVGAWDLGNEDQIDELGHFCREDAVAECTVTGDTLYLPSYYEYDDDEYGQDFPHHYVLLVSYFDLIQPSLSMDAYTRPLTPEQAKKWCERESVELLASLPL